MPLYIDGVCINNRASWLQHKKNTRELILASSIVRKNKDEYILPRVGPR